MELIDAAVSNDYDEVKRLLESGADPDVQSELEDDLGFTALMWAASNNDEKMVDLLIEHGANPYLMNSYDEMPYTLETLHNRRIKDKLLKYMKYYYNLHSGKQKLALANSRIPRLSYNTPLKYLDNDVFNKLLEEYSKYKLLDPNTNFIFSNKLSDQHRMDKLTKSKQRLATIKGIRDRNSVLQYLREPELIENVSGYLEDYKPDLSVHRRMMLEDENDRIADYLNTIEQYGMGKHSKKRSKKSSKNRSKKHGNKYKTKKRRNHKNRY